MLVTLKIQLPVVSLTTSVSKVLGQRLFVNQESASQEPCTGSCSEWQTLEVPVFAAMPAHPVRKVNVNFPGTPAH